MVSYEKLTKAGIDMDALLKRLMGNASLIKLFINKFIADGNFASLKEAIAEHDMDKAEHASHTLKGMCGNMSLTSLFDKFTEQVNHIRAGEYDKAEKMMPEITSEYENTISYMNSWLAD